MEDLEFRTEVTSSSQPAASTSTTSATVAKTVTATTKKRQMNLTDMFAVTPGTKRQRTTSTGSNASASSSASTSVPSGPPRLINGIRPFNTIPFNMEAFKATLSEEEAKLLSLECETMGRTWVCLSCAPHDATLNDLISAILALVAQGSCRRNQEAILPRIEAFPMERGCTRPRRSVCWFTQNISSS